MEVWIIASTRLIKRHIGKGKSIARSVAECLDYGKNPVKTENGDYVCSYACDPRTIDALFVLQKEKYNALTGRVQNREKNVLVYQIRQSFKPGEISPEDANRIGYDLAMRWTKGKHAFMVATHTDKAHIHNHIYYNSTTLDCTRKYVDFFFSGKALRKLSDQICLENGLSIIENPKRKGKHYVTWLGDAKEPSYLEKLRQAIEAALVEKPDDFNAFLSLMEDGGYEIKQGVHLSFKAPGQTRPTRLRSLKDDNYTEDAIRERISGARIINDSGSDAVFSQPVRLNLLIDLQNSIKVKNSPGYERWAKVFNLKQLAQTFNFLQENNLTDYEVLKEKTEHAISNFNQLSDKIKQTEKRMNEVSDLQKHISNYSRTRDVFIQYRKSGYNKNFYAEHEQEIILQKAAKQAFDKQNLKKLPTIKMLRQEYAALLAEKKTLYQSYRSARDEMKKYTTAKANADQLLNYSSQQVQEDIRGKDR